MHAVGSMTVDFWHEAKGVVGTNLQVRNAIHVQLHRGLRTEFRP